MKRVRVISALLLVAALTFGGCTKDGKIGLTGPQGEQGPKGDKGDMGKKGDKGDSGTANVIYSDWIKPKSTDWVGVGTKIISTTIEAPKLTRDILSKGVVMVYIENGSSSEVIALPAITYITTTTFIAEVGKIEIADALSYDQGVGAWSEAGGMSFRYVLIPGGIHARRAVPAPDFSDYHAVCAYYGIPE